VNRRQFLSASAAVVATGAALPARSSAAPATKPTTRAATTRAADDVPGDVVWHDVREWGVEGRAFDDTAAYFERLPARAKGVVRDAVWNLSRHTSGMSAFFETDAPAIYVRYALLNAELAMPHMPATGVSGVDLYANANGAWRWLATHSPRARSMEARLIDRVTPARRAYQLNLPLYNGVTSLEVGVRKGTAFAGVPPRKAKPVLFYGTSITQGGCASRPGMSFTSILGRRLNRPMLNFGFSGNGKTEAEVARFLAELDPALFVLDTSPNTPAEQLRERTVAVVRLLRSNRPTTPVLLLEERNGGNPALLPHLANLHKQKTDALRGAYDDLTAAGVANLHYRAGEDLIGADGEATVDGSHPTDLGMIRYADALEPDLRRLLGA
jgi:lysophospholipase L1-like esterase